MINDDGLPAIGFVRLRSILAPKGPLPIGKSTWWAGIKTGEFPPPLKLAKRISVWRVEDIRELIERVGSSRNGGRK
jgi:prophage regulatory protein